MFEHVSELLFSLAVCDQHPRWPQCKWSMWFNGMLSWLNNQAALNGITIKM